MAVLAAATITAVGSMGAAALTKPPKMSSSSAMQGVEQGFDFSGYIVNFGSGDVSAQRSEGLPSVDAWLPWAALAVAAVILIRKARA